MRCLRIANIATFILNANSTCMNNSKNLGIQNQDTTQNATYGRIYL